MAKRRRSGRRPGSAAPADPIERPDLGPGDLEGYTVDRVPAFRATKTYTCPECHAVVAPRVGHVVAWPDGLVDLRRHWHLHCWRLFVRRGGD